MTEPTDPRSLEALRRDREALAPNGARTRVASRLSVLGPRRAPATRGEPAPRVTTGGLGALGRLALTFAAGGAAGALLHAETSPTRIVYVDRSVSSIPSARLPSTSSTDSGPSAARFGLAPPAPAVPFAPAAPPTPPASAAPATMIRARSPASPLRLDLAQMDAERALLDAARVALVSGDSDTALRALDQHAQTYGHPMLAEERDALFVQTLVRAGRYEEARARADAFRRRTPQSLFLHAVDAAIASIP